MDMGAILIVHALRSGMQVTLRELSRARIRGRGIRKAAELMTGNREPRLDLGCGPGKRPGFIGVDLSPYTDIQWDMRWGLPFDDESVFEIRSDHFLEHLELPVVVEVLQECWRVLVPSGTLDFTLPHIDPYMDAYLRKDFEFLKKKIFDVADGREDLYSTCFDRISWLLHRAGDHKSFFDRESILDKVRVAGFQNVVTRQFDAQRDTERRFSSVYVVARKC